MATVLAMPNRIVMGIEGERFSIYRPVCNPPDQELILTYEECSVWKIRCPLAFLRYYDVFYVDLKKLYTDVSAKVPDTTNEQVRYYVQTKVLSNPDAYWMLPHTARLSQISTSKVNIFDDDDDLETEDPTAAAAAAAVGEPLEQVREGSIAWRLENVKRINLDINCHMNVLESKKKYSGAHCNGGYNYALKGTHSKPTAVYDFCRMYPNLVMQLGLCVTRGHILPHVMDYCFRQERSGAINYKLTMNAIIGSLGEYGTRRNWLSNRFLLSRITSAGRRLVKTLVNVLNSPPERTVLTVKTDSVQVTLLDEEDPFDLLNFINSNVLQCNPVYSGMRVKLEQHFPSGVNIEGKHKYSALTTQAHHLVAPTTATTTPNNTQSKKK